MINKETYSRPSCETAAILAGSLLSGSDVTGTIGDVPWDDYVED